MDSIKNRIEELRRLLNEYNHQYYVLSSPTVSDKEFDMLMKELGLWKPHVQISPTPSPPLSA